MTLLLGRPHANIAGESDVDIHDSVRGKNVYIVQSSGRDTNNHLMGLLLFVQVQ